MSWSEASVVLRLPEANVSPSRHYTEQPSALEAEREGSEVLHLRGGGFVTRAMVDDVIARTARDGIMPACVLIDLRDVAGYDHDVVDGASRWLSEAEGRGVRKIALLASSSVLRTATAVVARRVHVALRTFDHERSARRWLSNRPPGDTLELHP